MFFLEKIFPGFAFACTFVLFSLALGQAWIYKRDGHRRSFDLAIFCFFSGIFALNVGVAHSRLFPREVVWFTASGLQIALFGSFFFYLKSLSYFIVIPSWLKKFYYSSQILLATGSVVGVVSYYLFSYDIFWQPDHLVETGNFFVDSYANVLGYPTTFISIQLAFSSLVTLVATTVVFRRVIRGSKDIFFIIGLFVTMSTLVMDHLLLPFTLTYYVPLLFFANLVEAFRMCYLTSEESLILRSDPKLRDNVAASESFQDTAISEDRVQRLAKKLSLLMENERVFTDPNINLESLAYRLGIPSYLLTQVLSFGLKQNFYELINFYRIEEIKKLLSDPAHEKDNIIDLAYQVGYNSKSSFNAAFKKHTGQTPSEYRQRSLALSP